MSCWVLGVAQKEHGCFDTLLAPSLQGQPHPWFKGLRRNKRLRRIQEFLATSSCVHASGKEEGHGLSHQVGDFWQRRLRCLLHSCVYPLALQGRRGSSQSYGGTLNLIAPVGAVTGLTLPLSATAAWWVVAEHRRIPCSHEECHFTDTVYDSQHVMVIKHRGLLVGRS